MRLQRPIYAQQRVAEITLRVRARDLPESSRIDVTDLQLQAGEDASGPAVNVEEVPPAPAAARHTNGVIFDGMEAVILSNLDETAPATVEVRNAAGRIRAGSYRFGSVNGSARVDGRAGTASQGWGRAPVVTARSDLMLRGETEGRAHIRVSW